MKKLFSERFWYTNILGQKVKKNTQVVALLIMFTVVLFGALS